MARRDYGLLFVYTGILYIKCHHLMIECIVLEMEENIKFRNISELINYTSIYSFLADAGAMTKFQARRPYISQSVNQPPTHCV